MSTRAWYFEAIGLIFVALSVGWQVFIEQPVASLEAGERQYEAEGRTQAIGLILTDMYTHQYPERSHGMLSSANIPTLYEHFKSHEVSRPVRDQAKYATVIRLILFGFGSIMIIAKKWKEAAVNAAKERANATS